MTCENEFKEFWKTHNLEAAKTQLESSYVWLQKYGGSSVSFSDSMLTCSYLKYFYEFKANAQALNLNYAQLLNYWLQDHKTAVEAVEGAIQDEIEYKQFLKSKSTLENFIDSISSAIASPFAVPVLFFGAIILAFFLLKDEL